MVVNEFRSCAVPILLGAQIVSVSNISLWPESQLKGLCPSRAEGIAGFALSPAGFPHLSLPNKLGSCKTALNGPPSRVGDPPSLADRQGCSAALTLKGRR